MSFLRRVFSADYRAAVAAEAAGNVELAAGRVANVGSAATGSRRGNHHLHQQLVWLELRFANTAEEIGGRDPSLPAWAGDDQLGIERQQGWRHVRRGRGIGQVATERGQVTDLKGSDHARALG